jgi:hypothetical protein
MTKECVHTQLFKAQEVKIDFTQDSEYKKMFMQHTTAIKQQSELINQWVEQEEKRPPPTPPKSPYK